jgi:hypothetical protein
MIGTMRLIDELGNHSHYIYSHLKDRDITGDAANDQMKEDKKKVFLLSSPNAEKWRLLFEQAEKFPLFKGAIRALFNNPEDYNFEEDINQVQKCWDNALVYFNEKGVVDKYRENAKFLQAFISKIEDFKSLQNYHVFDNESETWKTILKGNQWHTAIYDILLGNMNILTKESHDPLHKKLYETELLVYVADEMKSSWIRNIHGHMAIYPSLWGIFLDAEKRDTLLNRENITIFQGTKVPNTLFIRGWDINFEYQGTKYQWNSNRNIYLLTDNDERTKNANNEDIKIEESVITNENFFVKLKELCPTSNPLNAIS